MDDSEFRRGEGLREVQVRIVEGEKFDVRIGDLSIVLEPREFGTLVGASIKVLREVGVFSIDIRGFGDSIRDLQKKN